MFFYFARQEVWRFCSIRVLCPRTDGIWLTLLAFFRLSSRVFLALSRRISSLSLWMEREEVFVAFIQRFFPNYVGLRHRIIDFPRLSTLPACGKSYQLGFENALRGKLKRLSLSFLNVFFGRNFRLLWVFGCSWKIPSVSGDKWSCWQQKHLKLIQMLSELFSSK